MANNTMKIYICKNCGQTSEDPDKCPTCGCDELEEFYAIGMGEAGTEPIWTTPYDSNLGNSYITNTTSPYYSNLGDSYSINITTPWDELLNKKETWSDQTSWINVSNNSNVVLDTSLVNWMKTKERE